jgi:hypothetical protein
MGEKETARSELEYRGQGDSHRFVPREEPAPVVPGPQFDT